MFRGASKQLSNHTGHTAYQVAVAASYHNVADAIHKFRPEDVGWYSISLSQTLIKCKVTQCNVIIIIFYSNLNNCGSHLTSELHSTMVTTIHLVTLRSIAR